MSGTTNKMADYDDVQLLIGQHDEKNTLQYAKKIKKCLMVCGICNSQAKNPKLLPCHHTYCSDCLKQGMASVSRDRQYCCPQCHIEVPIGKKGAEAYPHNFLEDILFDVEKNFGMHQEENCTPCKRTDKGNTRSFHYCLECNEMLCQGCTTVHNSLAITSTHHVMSLREIKAGRHATEMKKMKQKPCKTHSQPSRPCYYEYYCETCKTVACQQCCITEHSPHGHPCSPIPQKADKHRRDVKICTYGQVRNMMDKQNDVEKLITDIHNRLKTGQTTEVQKIVDHAEKMMKIILEVKTENIKQVESLYSKEIKLLTDQLSEEHFRRKRIETTNSFIKAFTELSSDVDFLDHENFVQTQLEVIRNEGQAKQVETTHPYVKQIKPLDETKFTQDVRQSFGEIQFKREMWDTSQEKRKPQPKPPIPEKDIKVSRSDTVIKKMKPRLEVSGERVVTPRQLPSVPKVPPKIRCTAEIVKYIKTNMTTCNGLLMTEAGEVIAVGGRDKKGLMKTYSKDICPQNEIEIPHLGSAWNILEGSIYFYISDYVNRKIFVVDNKGKAVRSVKLPDEEDKNGCALGLAMDDDENVYIASSGTSRIYKWNPKTSVVKPFLPINPDEEPEITDPCYICVTPSQDIIVSNGGDSNIQAYTRDGRLKWEYTGEECDESDLALNDPTGVCADREGNIYVCDSYMNRIQVIDSQGQFIRSISLEKVFKSPSAITLTNKGEILVADNYDSFCLIKWYS